MLYFIQEGADGPIKIGMGGDPDKRLVGLQVGNPRELFLRATCPGDLELELRLHEQFREGRLRGEWFAADTPGLAEVVACAKALPAGSYFSSSEREAREARAVALARLGRWDEARELMQSVSPESSLLDG